MTDEQINIAIAEACGWTSCQVIHGDPMGRPPNTTDVFKRIADYTTDLNAMHEAVMTLSPDKRWDYAANLSEVATRSGDMGWGVASATARQSARAFLRTIGKWRNE